MLCKTSFVHYKYQITGLDEKKTLHGDVEHDVKEKLNHICATFCTNFILILFVKKQHTKNYYNYTILFGHGKKMFLSF